MVMWLARPLRPYNTHAQRDNLSSQLRFPNLNPSDCQVRQSFVVGSCPCLVECLTAPMTAGYQAIGKTLPDGPQKIPEDMARWSLGERIITRWGVGRGKNTVLSL